MVGKKGYFFTVDAIIASTVLLVGLFYLFTVSITMPEQTQTFTTSKDLTSIFMYQKLYESTNKYYIYTLLPAGLVPYPDNTPLEEIFYLLIKDPVQCPLCVEHARNYAESLINESLDPWFGSSIIVNNTVVYTRNVPQNNILYSMQTIVYARMNATNLQGPVTAEVQLWY